MSQGVTGVSLGCHGSGAGVLQARRRFKCGKTEAETNTEPIAGDTREEASIDGAAKENKKKTPTICIRY